MKRSISIKTAGKLSKISNIAPSIKVLTINFQILPTTHKEPNKVNLLFVPAGLIKELQAVDPDVITKLESMARTKAPYRYYEFEDYILATGIKDYLEKTFADKININDYHQIEKFFNRPGLADEDYGGGIYRPLIFGKISIEVF